MSLSLSLKLDRGRLNLALNCTISSQAVTAIYGPSGAGKTSLLRCIAGLDKLAKGDIHFNGNLWQSAQYFAPSHQRGIAYVFQDARLFPHLNVKDNLLYAFNRRNRQAAQQHSIATICDQLNLQHLLEQLPATLSGGEQQRVAIGRALLSQPKLILMDEPVSALDQRSRDEVLELLEQLLQQVSVPIIYVSHNMDEISRLAEQLVIMEQGKIIAQGPMIDLCHRLDLALNHNVQAASILEGCVIAVDQHYQLCELALEDNQALFLHSNTDINQRLRIRIPARDVSLSLSRHTDSSILNILKCLVVEIHNDTSSAHSMVKLQLGEQFLLASITHKSLDHLQLVIGQAIYAQIKSVALLNTSLDT